MGILTIFERLRREGCTVAGALALMGNWQCESNLEPCRVQGDFTDNRAMSKDYATKVDNGLISDSTFRSDGKGWGLAQWTYGARKTGLLNFCRRRSISIANEDAQVDFAIAELRTEYSGLWNFLCSCTDAQLWQAVDRVCREYERPAVNNVNSRFQAANELRGNIQGKATEGVDNSVEADKDVDDKCWPPRMLCFGMDGADVTLLQALLLCHGYNCGGCNGIFNSGTKAKVLAFQSANGLDVDGIAGPKTFKALGVTW